MVVLNRVCAYAASLPAALPGPTALELSGRDEGRGTVVAIPFAPKISTPAGVFGGDAAVGVRGDEVGDEVSDEHDESIVLPTAAAEEAGAASLSAKAERESPCGGSYGFAVA